jgi:hypothetical protein
MTDEDLRIVFAELNRIGVDLEKPPGLAIGTGFRGRELIDWLGTLPDRMGHYAFAEQLRIRVSDAEPNAIELPAGPDGQAHREYPTVEQLRAASNVLRREWDPLGARLGELTRDDVAEPALALLQMMLAGSPRDGIERRVAAALAVVEQQKFGLRPSPFEQRRYLARRLMRVIAELPGPAHSNNPWRAVAPQRNQSAARSGDSSRSAGVTAKARRQVFGLGPRPDDPPAHDAAGVCSECGSVGTVAVAVRDVEPLVSRFCENCWRRVRGTYLIRVSDRFEMPEDRDSPEAQIAALDWIRTRMDAVQHDARYVASALWEDMAPYAEGALRDAARMDPATRAESLHQYATVLARQSPNMVGPMPPIIETLLREHGHA